MRGSGRLISGRFLTPPARWPDAPAPQRDRRPSGPDLCLPGRGALSSLSASDWPHPQQHGTLSRSGATETKHTAVRSGPENELKCRCSAVPEKFQRMSSDTHPQTKISYFLASIDSMKSFIYVVTASPSPWSPPQPRSCQFQR